MDPLITCPGIRRRHKEQSQQSVMKKTSFTLYDDEYIAKAIKGQ